MPLTLSCYVFIEQFQKSKWHFKEGFVDDFEKIRTMQFKSKVRLCHFYHKIYWKDLHLISSFPWFIHKSTFTPILYFFLINGAKILVGIHSRSLYDSNRIPTQLDLPYLITPSFPYLYFLLCSKRVESFPKSKWHFKEGIVKEFGTTS